MVVRAQATFVRIERSHDTTSSLFDWDGKSS
jgi:hypothetical protein